MVVVIVFIAIVTVVVVVTAVSSIATMQSLYGSILAHHFFQMNFQDTWIETANVKCAVGVGAATSTSSASFADSGCQWWRCVCGRFRILSWKKWLGVVIGVGGAFIIFQRGHRVRFIAWFIDVCVLFFVLHSPSFETFAFIFSVNSWNLNIRMAVALLVRTVMIWRCCYRHGRRCEEMCDNCRFDVAQEKRGRKRTFTLVLSVANYRFQLANTAERFFFSGSRFFFAKNVDFHGVRQWWWSTHALRLHPASAPTVMAAPTVLVIHTTK